MPRPQKDESRNHFAERAIPMMMDEGLTQKQAVGKAMGMFDFYRGKPRGVPGAKKIETGGISR